jgi:hypothetical protein
VHESGPGPSRKPPWPPAGPLSGVDLPPERWPRSAARDPMQPGGGAPVRSCQFLAADDLLLIVYRNVVDRPSVRVEDYCGSRYRLAVRGHYEGRNTTVSGAHDDRGPPMADCDRSLARAQDLSAAPRADRARGRIRFDYVTSSSGLEYRTLIRKATRWARWQLAVLGKNRGKHGGFLSRHCPLPGRQQPKIGAVERVSRQPFGRTER